MPDKTKAPPYNAKNTEWRTEDGLLRIQGWARDGLTDSDMSTLMGISRKTLHVWKLKYPEIAEALRDGKDVADRRIENALYKRALGFEYDEVKTTTRVVNGKIMKDADIVKTHKVVPGDVTAQIIWLKNRKPAEWRRGEDRNAATGAGVEDLTPLAKLLEIEDGE